MSNKLFSLTVLTPFGDVVEQVTNIPVHQFEQILKDLSDKYGDAYEYSML